MTALVALALLLFQDPGQGAETVPAPSFSVENLTTQPRREIVLASVPLPPGRVHVLRSARVTHRLEVPLARSGAEPMAAQASERVVGELVPAVPLMRWPDGSVSLMQVQVPVSMGPRSRLILAVQPGREGETAPAPAGEFPVGHSLPLFTEVEDPWGGVYRARLEPDLTAGADGILEETSLVRVQRFRSVHRSVEHPEQGFLGLRGYLMLFRGERRAVLTLLLDNSDLPFGPLGPVRLRSFVLVTESDALRFKPRFAADNVLSPPVPRSEGGYRQQLLGPGRDLYLGDSTAKAFRFDLFLDDEALSEEERIVAKASGDSPLRAIPDLAAVRASGAFGSHGGPAPITEAREDLSVGLLEIWRRRAVFGPFGSFGDPEDAAVQGSARNGPSALHNVVRWQSGMFLQAAEAMFLQHPLRPTPGRRVALPKDMAPFREGLGRQALNRPHGFTALDYEHFSVDLLFDYFWLTGDPLARDELARMGTGLRPLLGGLPFLTCRGEGWCLQAGVLIARATGDGGLLEFLRARFREVVIPSMGGPDRSYVLRQPPHPQGLGADEPFDAPWQMAALIHGLHSLYVATGDAAIVEAAVQTAVAMAGPGWVEGVGPKYLFSARDPGRFMMPVGHGPLEGTALMQMGAFALAAEMTSDLVDRALFLGRAKFILEDHLDADQSPRERWLAGANPWFQIVLDRGLEIH